MFKICGARFCGKHFSFDLPQGFNFKLGDDFNEIGIRFLSDDETVSIEISTEEQTGQPQADILQFCEENIYYAICNVFKVKRGKGEGFALFYNDKEIPCSYYSECYAFKDDNNRFYSVSVVLGVEDENGDKYAAKKVLNRPEVNAFFDSIEYH